MAESRRRSRRRSPAAASDGRPSDRQASSSRASHGRGPADRSEVRAAVLRFVVTGLITVVAVMIPVSLWIRAQAENRVLDDATLRTRQLAEYTVGPLISDAVRAGDQLAIQLVDAELQPWLRDGSLVRVKVWGADGNIIYSDRTDLIGHVYPLPDWSRDLLAVGQEHAWFGRPASFDNASESLAGDLVEINVRSADAAGKPVIFEAYFSDDDILAEQFRLWMDVLPVLVISLIVLQLAQLPPAIRLARRIQASQTARRWLVEHAIVASDFERRRIARELHDEVIQELAGLSYSLEAEEMHGTDATRTVTGRARAILQHNLRTLRAITTELYPPDLAQLGLHEALRRLADHVAATGIVIHTDLSPDIPSDKDRIAVLYRVARESLANVVKHSHATVVDMVLAGDATTTTLWIRDNGRGFDPAVAAPDTHLGLRIMQDTVQMAGGTLTITSRPGGEGGDDQGGDGTIVLVRISRN